MQLLKEGEVAKVGVDILDATKLWPEEVVPVTRIGRMTLDRNPYNYFAETEQVAFCTSHIVPGIDFTDDPLLQGRLFSYLDTQIGRFHSANFHQLPINQSHSAVNNYQQDGFMRYANRPGNINYEPNSLGGDATEASDGGFVTYPEVVQGGKVRGRPASFGDHFSQATLFYRSMTEPEKQHIVNALRFELGKVVAVEVKKRMLGLLANVDTTLVREVAAGLGLPMPSGNVTAGVGSSPALSEQHSPKSPKTRRVAILTADGANGTDIATMKQRLHAAGVDSDVIAPHEGTITTTAGVVAVNFSLLTARSVQYDAVYVPGGKSAIAALSANGDALHFIEEAYKHFKSIAATGDGQDLVRAAIGYGNPLTQPGVVPGPSAAATAAPFLAAITIDRHWARQLTERVSA